MVAGVKLPPATTAVMVHWGHAKVASCHESSLVIGSTHVRFPALVTNLMDDPVAVMELYLARARVPCNATRPAPAKAHVAVTVAIAWGASTRLPFAILIWSPVNPSLVLSKLNVPPATGVYWVKLPGEIVSL